MNPSTVAQDGIRGFWPPAKPAIGVALGLAGFLPVLVIIALAPAIPAMIRHFANLPQATTFIPLLVTTPGLVVAVLAPFAGVVVDRVGRRTPLLIATACYVAAGLAPLLFSGFWQIALSRALVGACEAFIVISINALLADYFTPHQRRFWLTAQGLAFPFLGAAVAALAGYLTLSAWNGAFAIYALVIPIWLGIFLFCYEPAKHVQAETFAPAVAKPFPLRETAVICGITIFGCAMFYVYVIQVGLAYDAVGTTSSAVIGRYIGLATLSAPLGALFFNVLSHRINPEGSVAVCFAIMAVGMGLIGISRSAEGILIGSIIQQTSAGMLLPSLILWVASVYEPQHRGKAFGLWSSANFASQFLSPLLVGGMRASTGDILSVFLWLGALTFAAAVMMIYFVRHPLSVADEL